MSCWTVGVPTRPRSVSYRRQEIPTAATSSANGSRYLIVRHATASRHEPNALIWLPSKTLRGAIGVHVRTCEVVGPLPGFETQLAFPFGP